MSEKGYCQAPSDVREEAAAPGDGEHVYTNVEEMAAVNQQPSPPSPLPEDTPIRTLINGWQEYKTTAGRSFFHHAERNVSQWNPPRFLRSPAQVQAFMAAMSDSISLQLGEHSEDLTLRPKDRRGVEEGTTPGSHRHSEVMSRSAKCVPIPIVPLSASITPSLISHRHSLRASMCVDEETKGIPAPEGNGERRHSPLTASFDCDSGDDPSCHGTIKCGTLEKCSELKKKEWQTVYMHLTSEHLIMYKDEKSAERHGGHYAAPLGVCDLRGAIVAWTVLKDRKKRKTIEMTLSTGSRVYMRSSTDASTDEWLDALREVIKRLPAGVGVGILDQNSILVRTSSMAIRSVMTESVAPPVETPSKETVIEKLLRFFRTRPSMEQLKQKGIYKHEAVFGSTLACISAQEGGALVPKFIRTVTELIETKGIDTEGIYRVSGNLSAIQKIRCAVDQDKYEPLVKEPDVHVLSGCLKLFFRELAEGVFPPVATKNFIAAAKLSGKTRLRKFDELLRELPPENRETLKHLFKHLHTVASHSTSNRMQVHNLAIVFGPTLFSLEEPKGLPAKKGDKVKTKGTTKSTEGPVVHSNSHMAYNVIMQGQVVEMLLKEHSKLESLKGMVLVHPNSVL